MTEKEYYLWSNKFNTWFILVSGAAFLTKIYIAAFVFEFCNSILPNKIHCTNLIMKCKLPVKTNKNERGIWGGLTLTSLKCAFLPLGLGYMYKLQFFFRQHYRIILAASLGKIYSRILGGVATIFFDNLK